jgi:hypothetical protein
MKYSNIKRTCLARFLKVGLNYIFYHLRDEKYGMRTNGKSPPLMGYGVSMWVMECDETYATDINFNWPEISGSKLPMLNLD